ncbi:MAG: hypothetical protein BHV88_02450 [Clostridiales bacterium 41_12_two_minus]|nr:MAG: hypothetical protein BHV88_02450 [Clostridiales bacterium 41_12_two_minus]
MKRFKKILKRVVPILLSLVIVSGTVLSNLQVAHATGLEETLYYTYWDLITTLYATCGYDTTIDENVVKNHNVTGKQVWDNFCTWVDLHVKAHNELVLKPAVEELKNLVNTATDKGVSLSQDLYDLLKECFAEQVLYDDKVNQFDISSVESVYNQLLSWTCASSDFENVDFLKSIARSVFSGSVLNIVIDSAGRYIVFCDSADLFLSDSGTICELDPNGNEVVRGCSQVWVQPYDKICDKYIGSIYNAKSWIVKGGSLVGTDVVGAQVSAGACPQEVPDVSPWIKNPAIPDEWRIVQPDETPDKDPDEQPDIIPAVIPIQPHLPDKEPDSTENPDSTETPGENPDKDKDKDKNKTPLVNPIINPDTGNVIDPETGWDIDPNTGFLINPDTGELVDPDSVHKDSNYVDSAGKYGDITTLFPFCIPFDLVKLIKGMKAKKAPPVFHFEYYFKSIDYNFVIDVDLTDYDKYIKLFRYGLQIFYVIALMLMTVRMSELFT